MIIKNRGNSLVLVLTNEILLLSQASSPSSRYHLPGQGLDQHQPCVEKKCHLLIQISKDVVATQCDNIQQVLFVHMPFTYIPSRL